VVLQAVRSDALPEGADHVDEGCSLYSRCLSCPLPSCRYDVEGGVTAMRIERRRVMIAELHNRGLSARQIGRRLKLRLRTVRQVLEAEGAA